LRVLRRIKLPDQFGEAVRHPVPDDIVVHVSGVPIFGGYDHGKGGSADYPPDAPVLLVKGLAVFGGVEVKRKPRKPKAVEKKK